MHDTSSWLQSIYLCRFDENDRRAKNKVWRVVVRDFFQKWVSPDDVVLDLGCGFGEFLNHIRCKRRIGADLNPDSSKFLDAEIEFHQSSVCSVPTIDDESVNVVFTSNVMEHLPDKAAVAHMIKESWRVLKPGGHFIALGPNIRYIPGEYWDFWDHQVAISDRSLAELLINLGFDIVNSYPRFLPYTTRTRLPKAPWLVKAYLNMPLIWGLLGGQFVIRAQKK